MSDMNAVIQPKSDQLNADDLIGGPRTITITRVELTPGTEQPVSVFFEGDGGKPYKSCKSMSRVMVYVWGNDSQSYAGKSMTIWRDPDVTWGGMAVGGIRISHMTGITEPIVMALTATKKARKPYKVLPLVVEQKAPEHAEPPRRTARQFLDAMEAELRDCQAWDALTAIIAREDVRKAQDAFTNGAAERLHDMIEAARERLAVAADGEMQG